MRGQEMMSPLCGDISACESKRRYMAGVTRACSLWDLGAACF